MKRLFYRVLILYLTFYIVFRVSIALFGSYKDIYDVYATLKLALPLLLYLILIGYEVKFSLKTPFYFFVATGVTFLSILWLSSLPFPTVFGFTFMWDYAPAIEYLIFGVLYFHLMRRKINNDLLCLTQVSFLLIVTGLLYKLPFFRYPALFYSLLYPFYVYSAWIMLVPLAQNLNMNIFGNRKTIIGLTLAMITLFLVYYVRFPAIIRTVCARLPFLFFWIMPLSEP